MPRARKATQSRATHLYALWVSRDRVEPPGFDESMSEPHLAKLRRLGVIAAVEEPVRPKRTQTDDA